MGLTTLNGTHLYHAFISGARQLINQKALLNKINVFPVPDGDTGSNMAAMMQRIITDSVASDHLGKHWSQFLLRRLRVLVAIQASSFPNILTAFMRP